MGGLLIYGWDISTSIVGMATFRDDGTYMSSAYCDLRKVEGQLAKADEFKKFLAGTSVNVESQNFHFVEERLGGFAGGRTSAQTLMKLAQFNSVVSYILWSHGDRTTHRAVVHLHPSTWKAVMKREGLLIPKGGDKKLITLEHVQRKQPSFPRDVNRNGKHQPWLFDCADAYCLGRAGFLKVCSASAS